MTAAQRLVVERIHARAREVRRRGVTAQHGCAYSEEQVQEGLRLYRAGMTLREAATRAGITMGVVYYAARKEREL